MKVRGHRLATLVDGTWLPHRYDDVFGLDGPCLVAAPSGGPLRLAAALLEVMVPPYRVQLEVLDSEGLPVEEGHIADLAVDESREALTLWLHGSEGLLESDARLAVLIHGSAGERIVYDEHNRLLLTGPIMDFEAVLISQGLLPGDVSVPLPHAHQYRDELTPKLAQMLAR